MRRGKDWLREFVKLVPRAVGEHLDVGAASRSATAVRLSWPA